MQWLKQGTVAVINFGPFLDKTDGVTLEDGAGIITSIDHATTGIKLSKNGGTLAVREQGANFVASIYDAHGFYKVSLSAIDTGTLGRLLVVHSEPATYLIVPREFMVVPANVYNSLIAGSDLLDVSTGGAGAITWTYTLTDSGTGLPIADADVWITSNIGGTNVLASGKTNASGVVTFYLDAGTVYVWRQKTGYDFTNPDTEVVS